MATLKSEDIIIEDAISFSGSAKRIWRITRTDDPLLKFVLASIAVCLILSAWCFVLVWYAVFGIFLLPLRLIKRSNRKQKRDKLRHRETLEAIQANKQ